MVSLKLSVVLGSLHVVVCDDLCSIADIRIQGGSHGYAAGLAGPPPAEHACLSAGIDASVLVQAKQMEVFARLRDVVVTDVNPSTVHSKVSGSRIQASAPTASSESSCSCQRQPRGFG